MFWLVGKLPTVTSPSTVQGLVPWSVATEPIILSPPSNITDELVVAVATEPPIINTGACPNIDAPTITLEGIVETREVIIVPRGKDATEPDIFPKIDAPASIEDGVELITETLHVPS